MLDCFWFSGKAVRLSQPWLGAARTHGLRVVALRAAEVISTITPVTIVATKRHITTCGDSDNITTQWHGDMTTYDDNNDIMTLHVKERRRKDEKRKGGEKDGEESKRP